MITYRSLVYLILDELKLFSDDSSYTEDHILYLIDKYRSFLLKQRYSDIKKQMPESNYQTLKLSLIDVVGMPTDCSLTDYYKRSTVKIPNLMQIGNIKVFNSSYFKGDISYVSRERMRYVGYNKYLGNMIYSTIAPDNYLYLKYFTNTYSSLDSIYITGIFQNSINASDYVESTEDNPLPCIIMDRILPLEEALIPPLTELIVKELSGVIYKPKDNVNNSKDDMSDMMIKKVADE
jgi:hypothetical protein